MKKNDLEKLNMELDNNTLSDESKKCIFNLCIIKSFIIFGLLLILFIISLIFNYKIKKFSHLFGDLLGNNKAIGTVIYYVFLIILLLYTGFLAIFSLIRYLKKDNWHKLSYKIQNYGDIPSFILSASLIICFISIYIITPCNVSGSSMYDTLSDGDKLLISDIFYTPKNNDIIVFDATNIDSHQEEEAFFIKRIKGVKGDIISYDIYKNKLYVNDEEIITYNALSTFYILKEKGIEITEFSFEIPKGYLLVLGDNTDVSRDSRYFGLIEENRVYGKVLLRIFPFNTFGSVD